MMNAANALLVPLAASEMCESFIPSKLFDSMACGRPVLLSVDGEARRILGEGQAGVYYPAESAGGLVEALESLIENVGRAEELGENGRKYALSKCLRSSHLNALVELTARLVGEARGQDSVPNDNGIRTQGSEAAGVEESRCRR